MEQRNIRNMMRILGRDPKEKVHRLLDYSNNQETLQTPGTPGILIPLTGM